MINSLKTIMEQLRIRTKYGMEFIGDTAKIETGLSEKILFAQNGSHKLWFYPGKQKQNQPLLFVYSLINRPYIFDLRPQRSMIEYLNNQGFDIYLIDWDDPEEDAGFLTLEDLIKNTIHRFVKKILNHYGISKLDILGYCMGATFAALYAGYQPNLLNRLVLLTPPLGNDQEGLLQKMASKISWDKLNSSPGIISGRLLKLFFNSIKPSGAIKKERDFWLNSEDPKFMEYFLPVEKWSNDTPNIPGKVFFDFLELCFQHDKLKKGILKLGDTEINLTKFEGEVLSIAAQHDWIIPDSALQTVSEVLPNAIHQNLLIPGGHIGLVVGKTALNVREEIVSFLTTSSYN